MSNFFIIDKENVRLDNLVAEKLSQFTRSHIKQMIDDGKVTLNGKVVKAGAKGKIGDRVEYEIEEVKPLDAKAENVDFDIVYEDGDLLVINKPQGLVVHPCSSTKDGTLVNGLLYRVKDLSGINGVLRPGIVHRLDKNTSGLMIVAKNDAAHVSLAKQIKDKTCKRKYLALVNGHLKNDEGRIETYIERDKKDRKKMSVSDKGKFAITNYKVLERYEKFDLVEFALQTGRTHQIRVHCKALGHTIVGDDVYGKSEKGLNGQLLHSYSLEFTHPRTNKNMQFEIGLPKHFQDYLSKQKKQP
ncbi:MAG: RluA family pseudouridine synthase [Clostridia bacterium]|nr:RluA family pseudouridine synthase [Clostridia bacterium]